MPEPCAPSLEQSSRHIDHDAAVLTTDHESQRHEIPVLHHEQIARGVGLDCNHGPMPSPVALDDFAADPEQWVAIITGAGDKAFCAGNDLKWQAAGGKRGSRGRPTCFHHNVLPVSASMA